MSVPKFGLGDKVFAKMRGYPPWPAKVDGVTGTSPKLRYNVYFYGTNEIAVCREEELCSYVENRDLHGKTKKYKGFNEGIKELDNELGLTPSTKKVVSSNSFVLSSEPDPDTSLKLYAKGGSEPDPNTNSYNSKGGEYNSPSVDLDKTELNKSVNILEQEELLSLLKTEALLLDIDFGIQSSLCLKKADPEACLKYLDELNNLKINALMLKKHPDVLDTILKLQMYVGNVQHWNMSVEEACRFSTKTQLIQAKAKLIYNKFQSLFLVPYRKTFPEFFKEELDQFNNRTKDMKREDFYRLIRDPSGNT